MWKRSISILVIAVSFGTLGVLGKELLPKYKTYRCKVQTKEAIGVIQADWTDIMSRSKQSNLSTIQSNIADLQRIRRGVDNTQWPSCSLVAKFAILIAMQSDIDQLLEFDGGDDASYMQSFAWQIFSDESQEILDTGTSNYSSNAHKEAKEVVKALFNSEIEKLDDELKSIRSIGEEYLAKSKQLDSLNERLSYFEGASSDLIERLTLEFNERKTELLNEGANSGKGYLVIQLELDMLELEKRRLQSEGLEEIRDQLENVLNQQILAHNQKTAFYDQHKDVIETYFSLTLRISHMQSERDKYLN